MSYQRSILKLTFDDPEFVGLEIKAKRLSMDDLLRLAKYREVRETGSITDGLAAVEELVDTVDKYLLAWNMTEGEDETPVPCTLRGMDVEFVLAVVDSLGVTSAGVSPPLPRNSDSGPSSEEELLPMESLSGDLIV